MSYIFPIFIVLLYAVEVKGIMTECDKSHNCLTCSGVPHDCASCPKGYFLARGGAHYTCRSCPTVCKECNYYTWCTVCYLSNHYGRDCLSVCSNGCLNSSCDQDSGTCLCKNNFEGGHCDYCKKGKYGFDTGCVSNCPANCTACVSDKKCTECKNGFYGDTCELSCARGCYMNNCDQSNGTCYRNQCAPYFVGDTCEGCSLGRFGNDCKSVCPARCVSCSSDSSCDLCNHGYWGDACQNICSSGCLENVCMKQTGFCQDKKCKSGFVGEICDRCALGKEEFKCNSTTIVPDGSSACKMDFPTPLFSVLAVLLNYFFSSKGMFSLCRLLLCC